MKRLIAIIICGALVFALAACKTTGLSVEPPNIDEIGITETPPPEPVPFTFTKDNMPVIDGSTATIPLIEAVYSVLLGIPRNEAAEMVDTSGTNMAYYGLRNESSDILLVYSPSDNINLDRFEMAPIGRDGLVFLVNTKNPVDSLTHDQIVSIYSGETRNWKDIGGDDAKITAFMRPEQSGSQTMMDELVMKGIPMAPFELDAVKRDLVISSMGMLIESVAIFDATAPAIGYNVYYFVTQMEPNENIHLLAIDGVEASIETISDGSYPFVSDFYAVIRKDTPENSPARILFNWIQSPEGQNLIRHEGYATASG